LPDDTRHGKRLYAERMVAIGVTMPHVEPPQGARDYAFDLVNRLIEAHCAPRWGAWSQLLVCYLVFGFAMGTLVGWALL
jgi:uncharacterized iron-regulated membrane protein